MFSPFFFRNGCAAILSRMRSPTESGALAAGIGQHQGELVAAEAGDDVRFAGADADDRRGLDQRRAAGQMPVRVVDPLEPVEIDEQQRQRPAAARGALGFPAQHLRQIPRVVELGQVVGDRQRLGPLHPQGVIERKRPGFQCVAQRGQGGGRELRFPGRRRPVDADERPDGAATALEREAYRRRRTDGARPSASRRSAEMSAE